LYATKYELHLFLLYEAEFIYIFSDSEIVHDGMFDSSVINLSFSLNQFVLSFVNLILL